MREKRGPCGRLSALALPVALALPALAAVLPGGEVSAWGGPFFPELPELDPGRDGGEANCSGSGGVCWIPPERSSWSGRDYYIESERRRLRPGPGAGYRELFYWNSVDATRGSETIYVSGGDLFLREFLVRGGAENDDIQNLFLEDDVRAPNGSDLSYVVGISVNEVDYSTPTTFVLSDSLLLKGTFSEINISTSANGKDVVHFQGQNPTGAHRINLGSGSFTFAGQEDQLLITSSGYYNFTMRGEAIRSVDAGMGAIVMDRTEGATNFELPVGPTEAEAIGAIVLRRTPQSRYMEHLYTIERTDAVFHSTVWTNSLSMPNLSGVRLTEGGVFNLAHDKSLNIGEGAIDGWREDNGVFNVLSDAGATAYFSGAIGGLFHLGELNIGDGQRSGRAVFSETVAARNISVAAGDARAIESSSTSWFRASTAIEVERLTLDGNGNGWAMVVFDGDSSQLVRGSILAAEAGEGIVLVMNPSDDEHRVTFFNDIGSSETALHALAIMDSVVDFKGQQIWVRDIESDTASELILSEGATLNIENVSPTSVRLRGIYGDNEEEVRDQAINILGGGSNTVSFAGLIGSPEYPIADLNIGDDMRGGSAQFSRGVYATRLKISAASDGSSYARLSLSLEADTVTLSGTGSNVAAIIFNGDYSQLVTGDIVSESEDGGVVIVSNNFERIGVVFDGNLGASPARPIQEVRLNAGNVVVNRGMWASSLSISDRASLRIGRESVVNIVNTGGVLDVGAGNIDGGFVQPGQVNPERGNGVLRISGGQGNTVTFRGVIGGRSILQRLDVGAGATNLPPLEKVGDAMFSGPVNVWYLSVGEEGSHARFGSSVRARSMTFGDGATATFFGDARTDRLVMVSENSGDTTTFVVGGPASRANHTVLRVRDFYEHVRRSIAVRLDSGVLDHGESLVLLDTSTVSGGNAGFPQLGVNSSLFRVENNLLMRFSASTDVAQNVLTVTASASSVSEVAEALQVPEGIASSLVYANQALVRDSQASRDLHTVVNLGDEAARRLAEQLSVQRETLSAASVVPMESGARAIGLGLSRLAELQRHSSYAKQKDTSSGLSLGDSPSSVAALWIKPFVDLLDQEHRDDIPGYQAYTLGLIAGWELSLSEKAALGALVAYTDTDVDSSDSSNSQSEIANYLLGMYGRVARSDDHWEWHVVVGRGAHETRRSVAVGGGATARGNFDSKHYSAGLLWGRSIKVGGEGSNFHLTPEVEMSISHVIPEDYTETGAGNLNQRVEPEDVTQIETRVSVRWRHDGIDLPKANTQLAPYVQGGLSYDLAGDEASAISRYTRGGAPFVVQGATVERFGIDAGLGMVISLGEHSALDFQYDMQLKSSQIRHSLAVEARIIF